MDLVETRVNPNMRHKLYALLFTPEVETRAESIFNLAMMGLIGLNVLAMILETEADLYQAYTILFDTFETVTVLLFTLEYATRLWAVTADPDHRHPVFGRIRFIFKPMSLIDLVAFLPFYLPWLGVDLRFVRSVRLFRLFRIFKLEHYSSSMRTLSTVLASKRQELLITLFSGAILLVLASSLMYLVEHLAQPEAFSSIPAAMWWGVVTLTTVGYGDIYPITILGKMLSALISFLGIGLFALPAGIIASGFAEKIHATDEDSPLCPHCGAVLTAGSKDHSDSDRRV